VLLSRPVEWSIDGNDGEDGVLVDCVEVANSVALLVEK
jgi:hypothetical protein